MPVVAVGLITGIEQVEAIVGTGDADMIALARTILYDPRWPWHAAAELGAQVRAQKQYLRVPSRDSTRICSRIGRRLGHRTDCRVRPRARVARMRRNPRLQRRAFLQPDAFQRVHAIRRIVDWLGIRSPISQSRRASSREFAKDYV